MREGSAGHGPEEPVSVVLSTTGPTDLLSLSQGCTYSYQVHSILVVNDGASATQVSVYLTVDSTDRELFSRTIGAHETTTIGFDTPLKLVAKSTTRKIWAKASAPNALTLTLIYSLVSQTAPY
ncbi:hypothetical protein EN780_03025 [Mesorhizobium sp. M4B.F.Ca.ET.089.01.1.1]|uniref:hypothetical protein n=1 Tax=Mesorhizobium sp. M4B.F.Ca.ET.089.01.1.1 TaxID=2496662 RepID=UPI000FE2C5F5|nr:hypothetical protein [Mesorhizobium sp. M4B.F.Ca.ET.089.01.1.1]RWX70509.1 hypothetical protein EN780_03025 [Mesorhizobium sp. M4B.F.Ca.ET.089.01.1.1]